MSSRPTVAALLACLALAAGPADASAHPLTVRAHTRVTLTLDRRPDGVVVRGRLVDDQGLAVPLEEVQLDLPGYPTQTRITNADGAFEVAIDGRDLSLLEASRGRQLPWTLRYHGDRVYGASLEEGVLDLHRVPTRLVVTLAPEVVTLDQSEIRVHVDAYGNNLPIPDAEVRVRVGDGTELVGRTGSAGRSTFLIRAGLLGSPGRYDVHARFLGDHLYSPADAEATLRVLLPARVTLRVGREGDVHTGRYRFSGRLADADGPLAGATVAILATPAGNPDAAPLVQILATTHADGIYLDAIPAETLFEGLDPTRETSPRELDVRAVFSPGDGRHQGAISLPVRIHVPPPPGVPTRWYLVGLAIVFGILLLAQAVRHRVLSAFWERLRAVRPERPRVLPDDAAEDDDPPFVVAASGGRSPRLDHIAGVVVDAHSEALLVGAYVTLTPADGGDPLVVRCGANGRFDLGPLPAARYRLHVEAADYLAREVALTLPHDGDLDGATFALVSIRRRVRDTYVRAVMRFGSTLSWGVDTPREAFFNARRTIAPDEQALLELRQLVEGAWFSERPATVDDAARARRLLRILEAR
ncbi:MAG: hypothetical protein EP329_26540 [Deltaproteobacteria bacterium]|nr:MAG: hypothetical protein EP329_26540 [Deltaproteobacteria bacterium]